MHENNEFFGIVCMITVVLMVGAIGMGLFTVLTSDVELTFWPIMALVGAGFCLFMMFQRWWEI